MKDRPVWAEVDLKAVKHNLSEVRRLVGEERKIMAVVKADAYGHGAFEVSCACLEAGADRLAVAFLSEAEHLRQKGISCSIFILGWTPPELYEEALQGDFALTIFDYEEAQELNKIATNMGKKAKVHIKIDTGMSRIGIVASSSNISKAEEIMKLPNLQVEGIFTHLSKADENDKQYSYQQLKRFKTFVDSLEEKNGEKIPLKHAANSASIIDLEEAYFNLVRPGIILYGLYPSAEVDVAKIDLIPAMSVKARVSRVEKFPQGTLVSYGGKFSASRETTIATLPVGYADGYTRLLAGKAQVIYEDCRLPVVGSICMDQCMIDATEKPEIKKGDEIIIIGRGNNEIVSMDEIAKKLGTINYEIACMISSRVPRIHKK